MALTPGTHLGVYEVTEHIGAGGMGEVYRASDSNLKRSVAIKVLPAAVAGDADRLARFQREAEVLAALNHPNIAAIYGLEKTPDFTALVMELVEGDDLSQCIARGPLPLDEALSIARQIADALEAAHEQGIVHRDLKPANIKVRADGTAKVLDFGLAKAVEGASGARGADLAGGPGGLSLSPTLTTPAMTLKGVILGTAAYMAPEQARGKTVDKRADIWAFGVVLYEMIAGRRGYLAEDVSETLAAVLTRDVEWSALPTNTPPRLQQLLRDCLVRDPKQRLRDIGEARRVLERLISGPPEPASTKAIAVAPATPGWKRALPWTVAAIAAAAAIGVAVTRPALQANAAAVTRSRATFKEVSGFVALSRDGTKLVYTVGDANGLALALQRFDEFEPRGLTGSANGVFPVISPDGAWIAFSTNLDPPMVMKIPIEGGTPTTLCPGNFKFGAAWGSDDTIVFPGASGLVRVPANGGAPQPLTTVDKSKGELSHTRPQFLAGGRQLLFTVSSADGPQFAVLDLEKGGYRTVAKGGDNGRYAPTGHLLYVSEGTLFAQPFDLRRLAVTGPQSPVVERISTIGPIGTADYAFSETGLLVYSEKRGASGTTLALVDRKGAIQQLPGQVPRSWGTGRLSPNGRLVANAIESAKGDRDIWVVDLDRGVPTRLTFAGYNDNPIWTPDGNRVVYGARAPKPGVYAVAADGAGQPDLIVATDTQPVPSSIAPDGRTLLYAVANRTMALAIDGTHAVGDARSLRESTAGERLAQISPDGKWVAFMSGESGEPEVYLMRFPGPGPKVRVSTQTGNAPRWNRNGHELLYWTANAGTASLMSASIQTLSSTPSVGVSTGLFKMILGTTWDVAPDGQRFLVELTQNTASGSTFATVTNWFDELRRKAPAKK